MSKQHTPPKESELSANGLHGDQAKKSSSPPSLGSKKAKGKGVNSGSQGFEITIEAPSLTKTKSKDKSAKKKESKDSAKGDSPTQGGKASKKKESKVPEEVQKLLEDWDKFEKDLERKRRQAIKEQKKGGRPRSATLDSKQLTQLIAESKEESKSAESSPVPRRPRQLSVTDGIELAAQKAIQRKERNKRASDELKQMRDEVSRSQEEDNTKLQETEEDKKDGEEIKLRQWKLRMNNMKNKSREDYVSYYKTINKKVSSNNSGEVSSDSFVHYYLTLAPNNQSDNKTKKSRSKASDNAGDSFVYYYLTLRN